MPLVTMPDGANVNFPDDMPSEQIKGMIASKFPEVVATPSLSSRISGDVSNRLMQANQSIDAANVNGMPDLGTAARVGVNYLAGSANDAAKEIGNSISSAIPQGAKDAFNRQFAASPIGRLQSAVSPITQYAGQQYDNFAQDHPITADYLNAAGNLVKAAGTAGGIASGVDAAASLELPGAAGRFQANEATGGKLPFGASQGASDFVPPPTAPTPADLHAALNSAFQTEKMTSKIYYGTVDTLAEDKPAINSQNLKDSINSTLGDLQSQPYRNPTLENKFKNLSTRLDNGDDISLPELLDLRQSLNADFNASSIAKGKDTPYSRLKSDVNSSLDASKEKYPVFGQALDLADDHYITNVAPFDNSAITKYLDPKDRQNYRNLANRSASGKPYTLPADTQKRADSFVSGINDKATLDSIRSLLPPKMAEDLTQQVLAANKEIQPITRMQAAGKAVGNVLTIRPLDAIQNAGEAIFGPKLSPQTKNLVNSTKNPVNQINDYGSRYQSLVDSINQSKINEFLPQQQSGGQLLNGPQPMLALPAPQSPIVVSRGASARMLSPAERDSMISQNQAMGTAFNDLGSTPDIRSILQEKMNQLTGQRTYSPFESEKATQSQQMWAANQPDSIASMIEQSLKNINELSQLTGKNQQGSLMDYLLAAKKEPK